MSRRWDVEVKPNDFDDVGADEAKVESGGVLAFYSAHTTVDTQGRAVRVDVRLSVAYAAHAWLTVSEHEGD